MAGSARIGALHVALGLNSAEFQQGLKNASSAMTRFQGNMKLAAAGVVGVAAGMASAFSFDKIVSGTREALDAFGAIADAAKSTGIGAELLQSLAYQAKLGGVEFTSLTGALEAFNKSSGLAVAGKGRMVSALKALNPALLASIQAATTQEERVRLAADAINQAATASEKAALATTLFGDAGAKLAGVFAGGAAEIDSMMAKAKQMGLIVDRDLIARADELGDQFDTTSQIVGIKLQKALIDLGPIIIGLINLGGKFAETMNYVAQGMRITEDQTREHLEQRLEWLQNGGQGITGRGGTAALAAATAHNQAQIAEVMGELRERALDDLRTQLTEQSIALPQFDLTPLDNLQTELASVGSGAGEASRALQSIAADVGPAIQPITDQFAELSDTLATGFAGMFSSMVDGSKSAGEAIADLAQSLADMAMQQAFQSLFSNVFSGLGGGVGGGPMRLGFNLPGYALGTDYAARGLALVGERGPEIVQFGGGERVIPNHDLMDRQSSSSTVSQVFHIDAKGAEIGVEEKIVQALKAYDKNLPDRLTSINRDPRRR